jgi:hypothetical protein
MRAWLSLVAALAACVASFATADFNIGDTGSFVCAGRPKSDCPASEDCRWERDPATRLFTCVKVKRNAWNRSTARPTLSPTTAAPTGAPTDAPSDAPTTPTDAPVPTSPPESRAPTTRPTLERVRPVVTAAQKGKCGKYDPSQRACDLESKSKCAWNGWECVAASASCYNGCLPYTNDGVCDDVSVAAYPGAFCYPGSDCGDCAGIVKP